MTFFQTPCLHEYQIKNLDNFQTKTTQHDYIYNHYETSTKKCYVNQHGSDSKQVINENPRKEWLWATQKMNFIFVVVVIEMITKERVIIMV